MTTSPTPEEVDAYTARVAEGMAVLGGVLAPILEAVEGYRVRLEAEGWPEGLARKMAADWHAAILRTVLK